MKKIGLILVLLLVLTGCGGEPTPGDGVASGEVDGTAQGGYVFEVDGITIAMHDKVAPILQGLGDAMEYFEAESCAFQGMERVYTYSGFELHTYEMDGIDYVAAIVFLDDSVTTKEGLYLFAKLEDVLAAYGDDYTKVNDMYSYNLGRCQLSFLIEDDEVIFIEYLAINHKPGLTGIAY